MACIISRPRLNRKSEAYRPHRPSYGRWLLVGLWIFAISQLLQRDCVTVESQNFICATVESQNFIFVVNISLYCKEEERER
ncbi:hypothetical protein LWI28_028502 [Acer negundo]|uniref:Uncharacterized protein n=1 Tax=Acer negundo TaxID=4023 RepID=A0AAD5JUN7_ACENE|nr:hypothetical protein LWI28_028502 [Acer negundo]